MGLDERAINRIIDLISKRLYALLEDYRELERREKEILDELSRLEPLRGTLEYKWVTNKTGKRYWYWYLRVRERGRLRSIYIGKELPTKLFKKAQDRARAKLLQRELRRILKEKRRIERQIHLEVAEALSV